MNLMNCINDYIGGIEYRIPIFTEDIYNYAKTIIPDLKRNILNEYVTRFQKNNPEFIRYQKGIYYKSIDTPFGKSSISYKDLINRIYIKNGDDVIGYESGPYFMNKIGLTTQLPAHTYLVTENNRVTLGDISSNMVLNKPIIKINKYNYRYLQFLDLLDNKYKVKIEANNYKEILRNYIDKYNLDFELLLFYAKYYKNNTIFKKISELAKGEKNQ